MAEAFEKQGKDESAAQWFKKLGKRFLIVFVCLALLAVVHRFVPKIRPFLAFIPNIKLWIKILNTWAVILGIAAILFLVFKYKPLRVLQRVKERVNIQPNTNAMKKMFSGGSFGKGLPPLDLLGEPTNYREVTGKAEMTKSLLNSTFKDFGLNVKVKRFQTGPTITKYFLELAPDVRLKDIKAIQEDIAIRVEAKNLRISSTNGLAIEIPNAEKQKVIHREVLEELKEKKLPQLTMAVGRTTIGEPYYLDLESCPHLLVGGTTGGGKSVCVNSLIITLLMRNSPEHVTFIMVDPKVIEFAFYKDLPHLLFPVANDLEKTSQILKWAVQEMKRRYKVLENLKKKQLSDIPIKERPFPVIIIVIDELAELTMSKNADEMIESLNSLARMARASGIHMIFATQKPDKDAVPGQLKANVPSAIGLKVKHNYESRIILGSEGAEKLIGKGDMLINAPGEEDFIRCQGSFLEDKQIEDVVKWWKDNYRNAETSQLDLEMPVNDSSEEISEDPIKYEVTAEDDEEKESSEIVLRRSICEGVLAEDEETEIKLPTIREISTALDVSKWAAEQIIESLKKDRWIDKVGETKNSRTIVILSREAAEKWLAENN